MTPFFRLALGALALAAWIGPAAAQEQAGSAQRTRPDAIPEIIEVVPGVMGGMAGVPMAMMRPLAHLEGTLAFLKTELAITAAQAPQWDAFAAALRAAAHTLREQAASAGPGIGMGAGMGMGAPMTGRAALTWPDRLAYTERILAARLDAVRALQDPVKALYAALSEAQKHKADALMVFPMRMF